MTYPEELLRGIPNQDCMAEDGYPGTSLFHFQQKQSSSARHDKYMELSINWRDDDGALNILMEQKKEDGTYQFKIGVAVLSRKELDRIRRMPRFKGSFNYERKSLPDNPYHGNLLLIEELPTNLKRMVQTLIAIACTEVIFKKTVC